MLYLLYVFHPTVCNHTSLHVATYCINVVCTYCMYFLVSLYVLGCVQDIACSYCVMLSTKDTYVFLCLHDTNMVFSKIHTVSVYKNFVNVIAFNVQYLYQHKA